MDIISKFILGGKTIHPFKIRKALLSVTFSVCLINSFLYYALSTSITRIVRLIKKKTLDSSKKDPFGSKTVEIPRSNDRIITSNAFEKLMEEKIFMTKNSNEM